MTRSIWKGPFVDLNVYKAINKRKHMSSKERAERPLEIYSRRCVIFPDCVGEHVSIHTGKDFKTIEIQEDMIGHKFGEFASTRKRFVPKVKRVKNKKGPKKSRNNI